MLRYAESPEALGISSAGILAYLDAVAKTPGQELHSLLLLRHGQIAVEMAWKPYDTATPHVLFSLSKSFTSAAVGFAVSEGLLSLTDRVADLLPDKLPDDPSDRLLRITVSDILCMGSGLAPESDGVDPRRPDWAKRALSYPVTHEPGTTFHYNSISTFLASEIVQRKCGQTVRDYLMPRLFEPLGIARPEWDASPMGVSCGGWGLHLSAMDIAKFGQLLLDDGLWEGKRILPEGWVQTASAKKIDNSNLQQSPPDWRQGYGYQFWRCRDGHYRGDGMYGQMCWVMPEQDAVVAITAGIRDMGKEAELLHDHLIPALSAPPSDAAAQALLRERVAALAYPFPDGEERPPSALAGRYVAETGDTMDLSFEGDVLRLSVSWKKEARFTLRFGLGTARRDTYAGSAMFGRHAYLGAYSWKGNTLEAVMRVPGAPYTMIGSMVLEGDSLRAAFDGAGFVKESQVYRRKARSVTI